MPADKMFPGTGLTLSSTGRTPPGFQNEMDQRIRSPGEQDDENLQAFLNIASLLLGGINPEGALAGAGGSTEALAARQVPRLGSMADEGLAAAGGAGRGLAAPAAPVGRPTLPSGPRALEGAPRPQPGSPGFADLPTGAPSPTPPPARQYTPGAGMENYGALPKSELRIPGGNQAGASASFERPQFDANALRQNGILDDMAPDVFEDYMRKQMGPETQFDVSPGFSSPKPMDARPPSLSEFQLDNKLGSAATVTSPTQPLGQVTIKPGLTSEKLAAAKDSSTFSALGGAPDLHEDILQVLLGAGTVPMLGGVVAGAMDKPKDIKPNPALKAIKAKPRY